MVRATWGSRIGFIFAAAGSAIGLANIWRMPYIVGENGGAAFFAVYLLCLIFIGFPVFIAELVIGRTTASSPRGAFQQLGKSKIWSHIGKMTILTGFIVSSFYSAVAAWILGYLFEVISGNLTAFHDVNQAMAHYNSRISDPVWSVGFHLLFLLVCFFMLFSGVRRGIERGNKIMMPLLFVVLVLLVIKGLSLPHSFDGIDFLLRPDWSGLTPTAFIIALGQSFFTLSLGQGTMVTYGSYVSKQDNLVTSCFPVVVMDTLASFLAAIAVFTIVFAGGMKPDSGPGLLFHTLPMIFGQIPGGNFVGIMFFLLVFLAAATSQISAMEPAIAYFIDERGWKRKPAVIAVSLAVFLSGIPSALSYSLLKQYTLFDLNFLEFVSFVASSILIPLGGFMAVILVGWVWGVHNAIQQLTLGATEFFKKNSWLNIYFWFCLKYTAPILVILVFLNALGIFG